MMDSGRGLVAAFLVGTALAAPASAQSARAPGAPGATGSAVDSRERSPSPSKPPDSAVERARAAARAAVARAAAESGATDQVAPPMVASTLSEAAPVASIAPMEPRPRSRRPDPAPDGIKVLVQRHAAANGVPFGLADAVIRIESRYNPRAANAGNFGLMQIRHQTARSLGYAGSPAGLLDAETNARFGMKYLAQAYRLAGGDTCRTVMKYQSGHRAERPSGANRAYCAKVRTLSAAR